jgi:hypothetical protein
MRATCSGNLIILRLIVPIMPHVGKLYQSDLLGFWNLLIVRYSKDREAQNPSNPTRYT